MLISRIGVKIINIPKISCINLFMALCKNSIKKAVLKNSFQFLYRNRCKFNLIGKISADFFKNT